MAIKRYLFHAYSISISLYPFLRVYFMGRFNLLAKKGYFLQIFAFNNINITTILSQYSKYINVICFKIHF
jgi:hypothetical protein